MDGIEYRGGSLFIGDVAAARIADAVGTPTYVYSAEGIRHAFGRLERAFGPLGIRAHYAVKACGNLHVCRLLRKAGAGMDVVSGGELE
ncbi:MAG: diaminopimelate decarboxylase, partial [Acidobacteria bacterium]|nr:diaminopimelate decarboxylase [Acidobacteriota bacterium]